jgi:GTPase involved in cell partitioning and DNA repair
MEEELQTDVGQRASEVIRLLEEYQLNRPDDIEAIERLRTELYALDDTMYANTQALIAPIQEEIDLAQANYDEGFTTYQNLDRQLRNETLHISNLTQERDDLINQINDLTIELSRAQGIKRQRRTTYKRGKKGKKGKNTRRRRL